MLIGAGLDARLNLPFNELREAARIAQTLGFESLWTPAGGVPDAFHVCSAWLSDTGLRTGTSVVGAARGWTPLTLALQTATLAQLHDGRFILGLGTGGTGAGFFAANGYPNRPIAVMRDFAVTVKALLAGETVTYEGRGFSIGPASIGVTNLPSAPVYLAALGPQMLRLTGEIADGALLNWASPERIAVSRNLIAEGAAKAGRPASDVTVSMYIRVCVDEDADAARRAFGMQAVSYAMTGGYRALFAEMGFDDVLVELEARRRAGEPMTAIVDAAPDEMLNAVGYFGPAAGAAAAYARLTEGLDETVVRVITARPSLDAVAATLESLTPALIRSA
ncbi:MAG: class flavin-dependent oxidoreductase [Jatrophihabitantaceae bacterium]|nr:class flavin-dependent oxidoreductase [Jatrophihabitantaceae bacterium]